MGTLSSTYECNLVRCQPYRHLREGTYPRGRRSDQIRSKSNKLKVDGNSNGNKLTRRCPWRHPRRRRSPCPASSCPAPHHVAFRYTPSHTKPTHNRRAFISGKMVPKRETSAGVVVFWVYGFLLHHELRTTAPRERANKSFFPWPARVPTYLMSFHLLLLLLLLLGRVVAVLGLLLLLLLFLLKKTYTRRREHTQQRTSDLHVCRRPKSKQPSSGPRDGQQGRGVAQLSALRWSLLLEQTRTGGGTPHGTDYGLRTRTQTDDPSVGKRRTRTNTLLWKK